MKGNGGEKIMFKVSKGSKAWGDLSKCKVRVVK